MAQIELVSPPPPAPAEEIEELHDSGVGDIPQWRLMARRFKRSKLAVISVFVLCVFYLLAIFATFLSPNQYEAQDANRKNAAPSTWTWSCGPAICGETQKLNSQTFTYYYVPDCAKPVPIHIFGKGFHYKLFGLISTNRHLFTVTPPNKLLIFGADEEGRDVFARVWQGARVSLTVGLFGVAIGTVLGAIVGTISGYFGGKVDTLIQRGIEVLLSIPTLPLWMTLAAVLPSNLSVTKRYLLITLILSLVGWAGLARQVRGKVMSYSRTDYVAAAKAANSSASRIILTHLLPNATSHLVVTAMLAIPATIIAETSLSFLGIGMLPPAVSWGVLLADAQQVSVIEQYPWLLLPGVMVVIAVISYQLIGDGLRDAVDPYA